MKIPVIRGRIGDWRYYSGVMTFQQIFDAVESSVDKFYSANCLSDLLQRELTDNYKSIKRYIEKDEQRFFNAIVLAIYDGDPQWLEVEFGQEYEGVYNVGFLAFNGDEKIFPVDGQHRVEGIKRALEENAGLSDEQVPVIFIAHSDTPDGKKRTRKLFSTLNRRAKPVGENSQIALDEDDINAIISRELIETYTMFQGVRLCNSKGKQIPVSNTTAFTSLIAFYQCNEILIQEKLKIKGKEYKDYLLYRPDDEEIQSILRFAIGYWDAFSKKIDVMKSYLEDEGEGGAGRYRNQMGGNILFRPIVLTEYVKATCLIKSKKDITFEEVLEELNDIPADLSLPPWKGVLWDGKKMINRVNHTLIRYMIMYLDTPSNLSSVEIDKMLELYMLATNYDGTKISAKAILDRFVRK